MEIHVEGLVRVVVTGGREYPHRDQVWRALDLLHARRGIADLGHGATPTGAGADWAADAWAMANGLRPWRFTVQRDVDGAWPWAGPRRNHRMLREFRPSGLVAFEGDRGTRDCVVRATDMGIPVWWPVPGEREATLRETARR